MSKRALLFILFAVLHPSPAPALAEPRIGFKETTLTDRAGERPMHVSLFYSAEEGAGTSTLVAGNPAFEGIGVRVGAKPADGVHPLVVLSHGLGGTWRNLSWLAAELVHAGYVVAAPDHPGTTRADRDPAKARRLWERPKDVSRVIDAVSADASLLGDIDPKRIAVVGHSLGGWTALELAGARFDPRVYASDCPASAMATPLCAALQELGLLASDQPSEQLGDDLRDRRIGAVVGLDPGPARGLTPESLAALKVPALVMTAGHETAMIAASHDDARHLAANMTAPASHVAEIGDTSHFSFVQLCRPGAAALIEAENPGESYVCADGGGRSRPAIHHAVAAEILSFLAKALPSR
ncbi:alpha/beta hydrolase family protein [Mangrovicella endophytica]|uniref:alpha/beta hydrolase family protein n=1 Tax=Mangrovicella endophytica TaxID=2066697 RepID=UPI0012FFF9AB|nr:alpha/beta fold hydrolase [Mangrovicella endophytica]